MTRTTLYRQLQRCHLPHDRRGAVAGIGILMGLARLAGYGTTASISFAISEIFGILLFLGGLALALTAKARLHLIGRIAASFAVFTFAFMSAGTWGNTAAILYGWCAALSFAEAISRRHDDGC
jgi:hypothetical protein